MYERRAGGGGWGEEGGAILVWALSWKLQPHYKWRHPEHMDRQTNGVRKAQREATPWLCDTMPSESNPPPPTQTPTPLCSLITVASSSSQRLNINGRVVVVCVVYVCVCGGGLLLGARGDGQTVGVTK